MRTCETRSVKPEVRLHSSTSGFHFWLHRAAFTCPHVSTGVSLRDSKDIRVSTCGMQTFTRVYGNLVDCGLISDFRFLFNKDDFAISNLISVISARAYEISPSVGPLGENRPFRHIWYFEKYHFETLKPLQFSCAVF